MIRRKTRKSPRTKNSSRLSQRQKEYESIEWKTLREEIFRRDKYTCTQPGCDGTCKELHCHHDKYIRNLPIWMTPKEYLRTVCVVCHSLLHHRNLSRNLHKKKKPR